MIRVRERLQKESGMTLAEVIVAVGILTIIMSTIGLSISLALKTQSTISGDGRAINELRNGMTWFGEDGKMAQGTDLIDGGAVVQCAEGVPCAAFTWTDEYNDLGTAHSLTYTLVGGTLMREYNSNAHAVVRKVAAASFARSGKTVTAQLEVHAGAGTTRVLSMEVFMELLQ